MKAQQKLSLSINGEYVSLILPELQMALWNKFQLRVKFENGNFPSDPVQKIQLLFMGTSDLAKKVKEFIETDYELYHEETNEK
ncbi:hypothetical protein [Lapidilactobacillus wuchangensis]|uniref:hypothetical protein n=1 Tax=Lapidilactobacillus wuchangensis TaxID=2486001 RepID=UPI000F775B2C|nr:hypothetical protein [Lapidilactobacillus wuchangensis]